VQTEVIGLGTLRQDDEAVWIEAQLDLRKKFVEGIATMAETGDLGWSSGTAEHLYKVLKKKQKVGAKMRSYGAVERWGIVEASLTPAPADWRNVAEPITVREYAALLTRAKAGKSATETTDGVDPFSVALANYVPSKWELESILCKLVKQVALMARMSSENGLEYDYQSQIQSIVEGYTQAFGENVISQIEDYLASPTPDDGFYLRSGPDGMDRNVGLVTEAVTDILDRFRGRRETRFGRGLNKLDIGRLTALRDTFARAATQAGELLTGPEAVPETTSEQTDNLAALRRDTQRQKLAAAKLTDGLLTRGLERGECHGVRQSEVCKPAS
jgi:hypothetical protein